MPGNRARREKTYYREIAEHLFQQAASEGREFKSDQFLLAMARRFRELAVTHPHSVYVPVWREVSRILYDSSVKVGKAMNI